jgi:hypothetical protein
MLARMLATTLAAAAIFHGAPVPPAEVPWFVTLTTRGPFCGGALIAPDRVLTAAHCIQGSGPGDLHVRINGRRREWVGSYFPTGYRLIPSEIAPDVPSASASINDIAVIVLRRPVTDVAPVPLAQAAPADGAATLTVGRGTTSPRSGPSSVPLGAYQVVVPSAECGAIYGSTLFHPALHLCTRDPSANAAQACFGDSGSPVLAGGLLAGVVTWGGETLVRDCGEGPADVSERALPHLALLTGPAPRRLAPYAERRVRVRRSGRVRRCVIGSWHPAGARFTIRWFRRDGESITPLAGSGRTRVVQRGRIGCTVTARTAGGWATEESYNAL